MLKIRYRYIIHDLLEGLDFHLNSSCIRVWPVLLLFHKHLHVADITGIIASSKHILHIWLNMVDIAVQWEQRLFTEFC